MIFAAAWRPSWIAAGSDAGHERSILFDVGQVADDVDVVAAGDRQVGLDHDAARAVERDAERSSPAARPPRRQPRCTVCAWIRSWPIADALAVDAR